MSTPLQWDVLEAGIKTWLGEVDSPLLPVVEVIWADQAAPKPAFPYFELSLGPAIGLSMGAGEVIRRVDLTRPAGGEMEIEHRLWSEHTLSVQLFTGSVVHGQEGPVAMLRRAINRLALDEVIRPLMASGITPFDWGAGPRNLTRRFGTGFQGQAQADVRCYLVESVSEYVGIFLTAQVAATYGAADPVAVELSLDASEAP